MKLAHPTRPVTSHDRDVAVTRLWFYYRHRGETRRSVAALLAELLTLRLLVILLAAAVTLEQAVPAGCRLIGSQRQTLVCSGPAQPSPSGVWTPTVPHDPASAAGKPYGGWGGQLLADPR